MKDSIDAILDILKAAGIDTDEDVILAGVRSLAADRKALMDANGELADEVRRLMPFETENRLLREQLAFMRDLVKTAIVQAGLAEQAREEAAKPQIIQGHDSDIFSFYKAALHTAAERDEARLAWAEAFDDGSQDAGKPTAVFRNLAQRYGLDEARRLCPKGEVEQHVEFVPHGVVLHGPAGGGGTGRTERTVVHGGGGGGAVPFTYGATKRERPTTMLGQIRRATGSVETVQFTRRADGYYVAKEPFCLLPIDTFYLVPPPERVVDLHRVLTIVAAYIDPSAPITYGRFVELLAGVPGLEGWGYSEIYPVLFNVQACTHPKSNDLDDLCELGNTEHAAREICAEVGVPYTPRCRCIEPIVEHSALCPEHKR